MPRGPKPISGIVLAGGASRRMGSDKARLELGGSTLLERAVAALVEVCSDVMIVGPAGLAPAIGARIIADAIPHAGPLGGLYTGLLHAREPYVLVVACDMPFLCPELLRHLAEQGCGWDAAVPLVDGKSQPLHAAYRREARAVLAAQIAQGRLGVRDALSRLAVRWISQAEIDLFDSDHRSFVNINTPDQFAQVSAQSRSGGSNVL